MGVTEATPPYAISPRSLLAWVVAVAAAASAFFVRSGLPTTPQQSATEVITTAAIPLSSVPLASLAVGIKTCGPYHETRLRALMQAWGSRVRMRAIGTDQAIDGLKGIKANETVVTPDVRYQTVVDKKRPPSTDQIFSSFGGGVRIIEDSSSPRANAYIADWRGDDGAKSTQVPPALTRRVAALLKALHGAYRDEAAWFLIADDDTFVRLLPLRAYLATLDATQPMMIGVPVDTTPFLTAEALDKHGKSVHCGGNAWVLSHAALDAIVPRLAECLEAREVVLGWYYDEVQLGRCLHSFFGLSCHRAPGLTNVHHGTPRDSDGLTVILDSPDLLTQHPSLPDDMRRLRAKFTDKVDAAWTKRFHRATIERADRQ